MRAFLTFMSSFVVTLNVVKYVWNDAKPRMDQIEKKQIKISITEPHDFLKGMLHVSSTVKAKLQWHPNL